MAKKTKLPFSMMPASWGLKGKSRAVAEAEYYYDGEDLEKALAEINSNSEEEKTIHKYKDKCNDTSTIMFLAALFAIFCDRV